MTNTKCIFESKELDLGVIPIGVPEAQKQIGISFDVIDHHIYNKNLAFKVRFRIYVNNFDKPTTFVPNGDNPEWGQYAEVELPVAPGAGRSSSAIIKVPNGALKFMAWEIEADDDAYPAGDFGMAVRGM